MNWQSPRREMSWKQKGNETEHSDATEKQTNKKSRTQTGSLGYTVSNVIIFFKLRNYAFISENWFYDWDWDVIKNVGWREIERSEVTINDNKWTPAEPDVGSAKQRRREATGTVKKAQVDKGWDSAFKGLSCRWEPGPAPHWGLCPSASERTPRLHFIHTHSRGIVERQTHREKEGNKEWGGKRNSQKKETVLLASKSKAVTGH